MVVSVLVLTPGLAIKAWYVRTRNERLRANARKRDDAELAWVRARASEATAFIHELLQSEQAAEIDADTLKPIITSVAEHFRQVLEARARRDGKPASKGRRQTKNTKRRSQE